MTSTITHRGLRSYAAGLAAEDQVAAHYVSIGGQELARRWRGSRGEIDLIFQLGGQIVFVEVKASRTLERAANALSRAQLLRIHASAEEYCGSLKSGSLTDMRIDVALVSAGGKIEVLENVFLD